MKVECIKCPWPENEAWEKLKLIYPKVGDTLTVRWADKLSYRFVEITNPEVSCTNENGTQCVAEPSFDKKCFKPITDISSLQKLTQIKVREKESV